MPKTAEKNLEPTPIRLNQSFFQQAPDLLPKQHITVFAKRLYSSHFGEKKGGADNNLYRALKNLQNDKVYQIQVLQELKSMVESNVNGKYPEHRGDKVRTIFHIKTDQEKHLRNIDQLQEHIVSSGYNKEASNSFS